MNAKFLQIAFLLLGAPALFAQDYEIRLTRALKAGDEMKVSVTTKMSQSMAQSVDGGTPQERKHEIVVQFEGVEKVLQVDADGRETKETLTVEKLTQAADGQTGEVVPKGTVVTCSITGKKPSFQIDGKDVEPPVAQALATVAQLSGGDPTDDAIFGTKERKKKGDSWDINSDLAKQLLGNMAGGIGLSDLAGKTSVDDVTGDALKMSAQITGKVKPPLPEGVTLDDAASFTASFHGTFPIDPAKFPPEESQEMKVSFTVHAETAGSKVAVTTNIMQTQTRIVTPVK